MNDRGPSLANTSLFSMRGLWWFNVLVVILMLNLAACTINHFPAMWRTLRRPRIKMGQGFFERGKYRAGFLSSLSQEEATDLIHEATLAVRLGLTIDDVIRYYSCIPNI